MLRLNRCKKAGGGFLLLEVLVSMAIISIGLVYIVRSFSSSMRAIDTSNKFLKSVALIEEKMWEIEAAAGIEAGQDHGRFEDAEGYTWNIEAEEIEDSNINDVKLKVEWKGPSATQRVSVETYVWNKEE